MPINVFVDQEASSSRTKTGVGFFTKRLVEELSKINSLNIHTYQIGGKGKSAANKLLLKLYRLFRYVQIDLPLSFSAKIAPDDVVLGANYLIPPSRSRYTIPVIHDLCFIDHPEWVQPRNAHILKTMLGKTVRRSAGIITISDFSASRIREIYKYDKPILVIDIPPAKNSVQSEPPECDLTPLKYFLFIGTIEPRKNIPTLLDAYENLPSDIKNTYRLVIAGKPGWDEASLQRIRRPESDSIIYLDYVTEGNKNWLYKNATATVVPSFYEGFGMMTLESLTLNCPVITSNIPPLQEIMGDSGVYFEPYSHAELGERLIEFTNESYRAEALNNQMGILKKHDWKQTAARVADFIEGIAK